MPITSLLNKKAPDFTLKGFDEKEVKLSQFKDKIVILDFFATFSTTAKKQVVLIEKLHQKYKEKGVVIIGITSEKDIAKIKNFATDNKITFTILLDGTDVFKNYRVTQLPMLYFISKEGNVCSIFMGTNANNEAKIDAEIEKLIKSISTSPEK